MANEDEFFDKKLKQARTFLGRWNGADGQLWELQRSHRSLRIVLYRGGDPTRQNLLLACLGPVRIAGPVEWLDSQIEVTVAMVSGREGFRVKDERTGLDVLSESLEIKENVKL